MRLGKWPRLLRAALRIQLRSKLRNALALLGIVVGSAALIVMAGIARGGRRAVLEQLRALGTNVLVISPAQQRALGGRGRAPGSYTTLKPSDAEAIAREVREVTGAVGVAMRRLQIKHGELAKLSTVAGVGASYFAIRSLEIRRGRGFDDDEGRTGRRVVVLGSSVAQDLFGAEDPLGARIKINRVGFEVVGVLAEQAQVLGAANENERAYIPLATALRRVFNAEHVDQLVVQVRGSERMSAAEGEAGALLRERHRLRASSRDDFEVLNQKELLDLEQMASSRLGLLTAAVAGISLLVGGIGILAVMTMAVRERTREIGLRRAIGAKRRDIFLQFLAESTLLSVLGALLGVLIGLAGVRLVPLLSSQKADTDPATVVFAFAFAAVAGVVFGLYPAQRASQLPPIRALRYE